MPNWNQLLDEVKTLGSSYDVLRRKYLKQLYQVTKRNIIIYYSGWLQRTDANRTLLAINDEDKIGFMTTINRLDRTKGLDLILHTPGGDTAATESLVDYLRKMFGKDIRAIVPQLSMSGGTMIACACKSILMGKHSSLGPVDPQFNGIPAHGVIEEFKRAIDEIKADPSKIPIWQPIINKYHPTFIGECEKSIIWSDRLVREWLSTGMFDADPQAKTKIEKIVLELTSHALTFSHARHLSSEKCSDLGLNIEKLEDNPKLQDAVLNVHHACMLTFSATPAIKIIENHNGTAFIKVITQMIMDAAR
jgi:ATP-dependent protease ClpP protease subunit